MRLRISDSVRIGPFRLRVSVPVNGKGRTWVWAGTRTPFGGLSASVPVGGKRRKRRG